MENSNPHNFRENAIKSRPNFKNSAKLTQQIRVEVIAFIINANLITACFTLLFRARIIIRRWKNKQKIRPFSSNGKIKNMCFVSLQQKLQMNKKSKDLKSKSVDEFSKRISIYIITYLQLNRGQGLQGYLEIEKTRIRSGFKKILNWILMDEKICLIFLLSNQNENIARCRIS